MYEDNLSDLQKQMAEALENGMTEKIEDLSQAIKFNEIGHLNHEFFWESIDPNLARRLPINEGWHSPLEHALISAIGSVDAFIEHFGVDDPFNGWGWIVYNKKTDALEYRTTTNYDRLIDQGAYLVPLLNINIFDYSPYIHYQNARPNYLKETWKVIDWGKVAERFEAAKAS